MICSHHHATPSMGVVSRSIYTYIVYTCILEKKKILLYVAIEAEKEMKKPIVFVIVFVLIILSLNNIRERLNVCV